LKVLFISSGNAKSGISPIVRNQGESLKKLNVDLDYYAIKGKGVWGYIKNIFTLRKYIKQKKYDIFHAHYSLSGFVASLSGCGPLIVSLMGSDVNERSYYHFVIKVFYRLFWQAAIVKSEDMKKKLGLKANYVVANGVDLDKFRPIEKEAAKRQLKLDTNTKYILFLANPNRPEKNYTLAKESYKKQADHNLELLTVYNVDNDLIALYLNAAECLLLPSLWEGSPNVIKEAVACNCPIVATDVGDVRWVLGDTQGCYISSFDEGDFASKLKQALSFAASKGRTKGRERIKALGLDAETVAKKIKTIYEKVLEGGED